MSTRYPGGVVRKNQRVPAANGASGVWTVGQAAQAVKSDIWPYNNISYPISNSLRFRSSASAYLSRTPAATSNRRTWTWSGWVKRGALPGDYPAIFNAGTAVGDLVLRFDGNNYQLLGIFENGNTSPSFRTNAAYRDPAAWYHIVWAVDTTQATDTNRLKVYVNGLEVSFSSVTYPTQNFDTQINNTVTHRIGFQRYDTGYFDGYMADINFVDGQQLTPSSFGSTNAVTGVWQPIQYAGTYGTNGYHLEFKDTNVGNDTSGNNNHWTLNNISTTLGTTYDLMTDVPTQWASRDGTIVRGNYCTLNPLGGLSNSLQGTLSNGNLTWQSPTSDQKCVLGTMAVNGDTTSKWYWEVYPTSKTSTYWALGVFPYNISQYSATSAGAQYRSDGAIFINGSNVTTVASYTSGDVIGITFDASNNQVKFYKNNTLVTTQTVSNSAGYLTYPACGSDSSGGYNIQSINFGQQPFTYTPPSGFKALNTYNLPTPTIGGTSTTLANKYFDATLYTGNGGTQTITNAGGFQPDFIWEKARSDAFSHMLYDSVRGVQKYLRTNVTSAEVTDATTLTAFNSNGFTVGAGDNGNNSGTTAVAWQWNAGGSTVTNTTGSITTSVRASPTAGFSVVTYSGNGTGGATIGHGLGVAPSMMIFKPRNAVGSWLVWHTGYNSNQAQMLLDSTAAIYNPGNGLYFNSTYPSSTVATLGTSSSVNDATYTYVAYMWSAIPGYSAFGSYTGNGSADGPFVYTGFRPKFILIKRTDSATSANWNLIDTSRDTYNAVSNRLNANISDAEYTGTNVLDILSNGFKLRWDGTNVNASGGTLIYAAFAEFPFKNALAR